MRRSTVLSLPLQLVLHVGATIFRITPLSIMTLNIKKLIIMGLFVTLSIIGLYATLSKNDIQHDTQYLLNTECH